jgi:hypothetical protein
LGFSDFCGTGGFAAGFEDGLELTLAIFGVPGTGLFMAACTVLAGAVVCAAMRGVEPAVGAGLGASKDGAGFAGKFEASDAAGVITADMFLYQSQTERNGTSLHSGHSKILPKPRYCQG